MKCFSWKPLLSVFASLCLFACGENDETTRTTVEIDPASCTVTVGETKTLAVRISPPPLAVGQRAIWTSDKPSVATVADGVVTAVSVGEATVTAAVGDVSAACKVTVVANPVAGIALDKSTLTLDVGASETLTATVSPENATDKSIVWTTDKPEVATVADGVVRAVGAGEAVITAAAGAFEATCTVTVSQPVTGIALDKSTLTLDVGASETLTATVSPENATDKSIVWTTDKPEVATVADGVVRAVGAGEAVITAAAGGFEATCTVTVNLPAPKIGDYFYSDGTWSDGGLVSIEADGLNPVWAEVKPAPESGKTVIGIVCQTFPERIAQSDKDAGYTHGYVLATKIARDPDDTVDPDIVEWSRDFNFSCLKAAKSGATWYNNVNGYQETMTVRDEYGATLAVNMPAFNLVLNHFPVEAPASTSGWFLPSTGQLWDAVANFCGGEVAAVMKQWQTVSRDATVYCSENTFSYNALERFNAMMAEVPEADKDVQMQVDAGHGFASIWTSTPYDEESACMFNFGDYWGKNLVECMTEWYDGECTVRPILAF